MNEEKGIFAENKGGDFEQVEPGSYVARCYKMIDIGTQKIKDFTTDDINLVHQVMLYWEILEDEDNQPIRMKDDRPFSVQKTYRLSMHPKAGLRKDLEGWRGKAFTDEESERFNITVLLDKYCRLNLKKSANGKYINVESIGFTKRKPEGHNEATWWSAIDPNRDMQIFDTFPDWLKTKIENCEEWSPTPKAEKTGDIPGTGSKRSRTVTANGSDNDESEEVDLSEPPF